ncbi:cell wall-active antibiotics response protein LiaF [Sporolactobacillus spathodeae]|uniref:Lia operon protein LiaF n=1 Tax=Sporolactobacillus spathodeae TaxID=1465502 RepID=A0ABS2QBF3_9BACL|nr:cell wall-active antibiotics response protein LiaF [Sporolactobacillus spathodeae]MBM7659099.1 lia operon protein LiaF [Sporolactobacillus spathodeae]
MFQSLKNDRYSWLWIAGLFALVMQSIFGGWGFLLPAALFAGLLYYGKNRFSQRKGKIIFFIGIIGLSLVLLSTFVFKLTILLLFLLFIYDFVQSKRYPSIIQPNFQAGHVKETIFRRQLLLQNKWFGHQQTPPDDYEWHDINIQNGAGDTLIDLSHTILPPREAVIVVRHLAGRVRILVPYGIGVSVRFSVILGSLDFLGHEEPRLINESIAFQTENYDAAEQNVSIIVSALSGNLEVRRI